VPDIPRNPDVLIVGAGVMGAATAWWLTRLAPDLRIVMVEADPGFARASSSLSASSIRQQFTCAVNVRLSQFGIGFLRKAEEWFEGDASARSLSLREPGYLYLANEAQAEGLRAAHAVQRIHGAEVSLLEPDAIAARFPWLNTEGLALGNLGVSGEGWFDGPALHQAFLRGARRRGATLLPGRVVALDREAGRITRVSLADGQTFVPGQVINAAGASSGALARLAGIALPVVPSRRTVFVLSTPARLPDCPLIIAPEGWWLRPEGDLLITGREPLHPTGDDEPLEPDWREWDDAHWATLAHRIAGLETLRVERAWAGFYEMSTYDHNAFVGPFPELANFHCIAGFSGHGMQHAAGAALGLAEQIVHGQLKTVDIADLAPARLARNARLLELNVIG
jgi:glycine/D-amino acid oxidase-like deaminating enzyme